MRYAFVQEIVTLYEENGWGEILPRRAETLARMLEEELASKDPIDLLDAVAFIKSLIVDGFNRYGSDDWIDKPPLGFPDIA